jgi:hypothetical protein
MYTYIREHVNALTHDTRAAAKVLLFADGDKNVSMYTDEALDFLLHKTAKVPEIDGNLILYNEVCMRICVHVCVWFLQSGVCW